MERPEQVAVGAGDLDRPVDQPRGRLGVAVEPLDAAEQRQRRRPDRRVGGRLEGVLAQRPGRREAAGRVARRGLPQEPARPQVAQLVGGEPARGGVQLGRGVLGAARGGPLGRLLELGGHGGVRRVDSDGEVTGSLVRVADHLRQLPVQRVPAVGRRGAVDGGGEQGMGEADPPVLRPHDLRVQGLRQPRLAAPVTTRPHRLDHLGRGRSGQGGGHEQGLLGRLREGRDAGPDQSLQRGGDGQWLVRSRLAVLHHQGAADLEDEQGVARRRRRQAGEERPAQGDPDPALDELAEGGERQRRQDDVLEHVVGQLEQRRRGCTGRHPGGEEQPHPVGQPPCHEVEHPLRLRVEPLDVVDSDEDRAGVRELGQHRRERRRGGAELDVLVLGVAEEQRRSEGPRLRGREGRPHLVEDGADEIGDAEVGQPRLVLGGPRLQHAVAGVDRSGDGVQPDGGLAHPRLALEGQPMWLPSCRVEQALGRVHDLVPTDQHAHRGIVADDRREPG